jgi:PAS domain-containing protein
LEHLLTVEMRKQFTDSPMISDITDFAFSPTESASVALSDKVSERILDRVIGRIASEPARVRTDAHGHVTQINPAFSGLCGYTFEEIRGRKPGSLLQGLETTGSPFLLCAMPFVRAGVAPSKW